MKNDINDINNDINKWYIDINSDIIYYNNYEPLNFDNFVYYERLIQTPVCIHIIKKILISYHHVTILF